MAARRVTFAIYTRICTTVTSIFYISVRYHKSIKQKTAEPASDKFSCDSVEPPAANLICASSALSSSLQSAPLFVKAPFLCRYFHGTRDSQVVSHVWRGKLCITINLKAVNQYLNHHHLPKCRKNLHPGSVLTHFLVQINKQFFFKYRQRRCNLLFHRKWLITV